MKKLILLLIAFLCLNVVYTQRYQQIDEGSNSITWQARKGETHHDHIEMSDKQVSVVLRHGVNKDGAPDLNRSMVWPMLRIIPNNTHGSLMRRLDWNPLEDVMVGGRAMREQVKSVTLNSTLVMVSDIQAGENHSLSLKRTHLPSADLLSLTEIYEFINIGTEAIDLKIPKTGIVSPTNPKEGVEGSYYILYTSADEGSQTLLPGKTVASSASVSTHKVLLEKNIDAAKELEKRRAVATEWMNNLVLDTPDPVTNEMFAFSETCALKSIYEMKDGPTYGPGGESYYAVIWANDQAEYINPYFPYVGYQYGDAFAVSSFEHFARYMNDEWKSIPSSIVAEGSSYWNGVGDYGDAAMIAYGAARYALASGNKEEALKLWPLIEWRLEFCRRKINEDGIIASDSDELEGHFPAGKANSCTSSLYCDVLPSAVYPAKDIGKGSAVAGKYCRQVAQPEKAIDHYFTVEIEGFDTYAYYEGNDVLRTRVCIPLTVGISKRATGTIDALFSPRLWTKNGLLTASGDKMFWDRSTLYALWGVFMAGETEKAMEYMKRYSTVRLLGVYVPYAVGAWPEGGRRHLSAESALYGRIVTEGIFGIRPTGLHSLSMIPRLPQEQNHVALRNVRTFGSNFDIEIVRKIGNQLQVRVKKAGKAVLNK